MTSTAIAFILYSVSVLAVGLWAARKPQQTAAELHLGNREHGAWTSALSSSASTESGFVLLGMVGMGYSVGANALWIVPAGILGYSINWLLLGPKLRALSARLDVVTLPEFIAAATGHTRLSRLAAAVAALLATVFLLSYVSAQFAAAGKALSSQFSITPVVGVGIGAGLVAVYSVLGGFRAVSWTDNIQAAMMAFALIVLPTVVVMNVGGLGAVWSKVAAIDPKLASFTAGQSGAGAIMAVLPWLMLGLAYPGQPHAVTRLMAAKDESVFRSGAVIAIVWFVVVYSGAVLLGMAARVGFAELGGIGQDPETTLPVLAAEFLPGIFAGITIAAILSAICSTADSTLLSAASTIVRDFRAAIGRPVPRNELAWNRAVVITLAGIAAVMAIRGEGLVFDLVLYAWTGLGASLGPAVLYCARVERPNAGAALCGLLVGGGLAFALHGNSLDLLYGFGASLIAIAVSHSLMAKSSYA